MKRSCILGHIYTNDNGPKLCQFSKNVTWKGTISWYMNSWLVVLIFIITIVKFLFRFRRQITFLKFIRLTINQTMAILILNSTRMCNVYARGVYIVNFYNFRLIFFQLRGTHRLFIFPFWILPPKPYFFNSQRTFWSILNHVYPILGKDIKINYYKLTFFFSLFWIQSAPLFVALRARLKWYNLKYWWKLVSSWNHLLFN